MYASNVPVQTPARSRARSVGARSEGQLAAGGAGQPVAVAAGWRRTPATPRHPSLGRGVWCLSRLEDPPTPLPWLEVAYPPK